MKPLKYSRQRESIKEFLCSTTSHPTADTVYMHIRNEHPRVSLGTVYRNLSLLVSLGEAQRLTDQNGIDHFDANTAPHVHFVCTECSQIYDLPMELSGDLDARAADCFDGEVEGHNLYFYGRCADCIRKTSSLDVDLTRPS
jgi:Fur family peroxide stress response transcriptional regulator